MGLDITAYRKLQKLDVLFDEDGEPVDRVTGAPVGNALKVCVNDNFPGRNEGLEDRAVYSYAEFDSCFSRSYGGYNRWREQLAKLAEYPLADYESYGATYQSHAAACWQGATGPFSELINFADNEGVIGPVVCAKLLKDFNDFDERASAVTEEPYFYGGYCDLKRGLEIAADGGCLNFH